MKGDTTLLRKIRFSVRRLTCKYRPTPEVLIIGAQKAGTTMLFNELIARRDFARGRTKEVHYFDLNADRGECWYRAQFPISFGPRGRKYVDASPFYMVDAKAAHRAKECVPQAKIVAMLRDPVDRAWSHYHHARTRGYESRSFGEAITEEMRALDPSNPVAPFANESIETFRRKSYVRRGVYVRQLEPWLREFGREKIHLVDSGRLFLGGEVFADEMMRVLCFLGDCEPQVRGGGKVYKKGAYGTDVPSDEKELLRSFYAPYDHELQGLVKGQFSWTR